MPAIVSCLRLHSNLLRRARDYYPIIIPRRLGRNLTLQHVEKHKLGLAIERIAPAAAAGGFDPHYFACFDGLAVDQTPEPSLVGTARIYRHQKWLAGMAAIDTVAAELDAIGRDDGVTIDQRAIMLVVPKSAAPLSGAS